MIEKNHFVGVKLSDREYQRLSQKAGEDSETRYSNGRENLSGYIRKCALNASGGAEKNLNREIKKLTYQIRKIGVNVNQVAKKINTGYGYPEPMQAVSDLKRELEKIEEQFAYLIQVVKEDGDYETPKY